MEEPSLEAADPTALFSSHCAHIRSGGDNDTIIKPGVYNGEPDFTVNPQKPTACETIPPALTNRELQKKLEDQYFGDEEILYVMDLMASLVKDHIRTDPLACHQEPLATSWYQGTSPVMSKGAPRTKFKY
ncbi:hypothetical protein NDU88_008872 [Pleurodeles waltl]|uniref:Uncharacterized protein n=1 Tax=Pleurodeles waltl TaxID=8319 RepID=A0AAV7RYX6_PLEWA|nr:hypothetical protein NDU88_008872 [Pleurodeles waltl]